MRAGEFARRRARIESERGLRFRPHSKHYRRKALRALVRRAGAALIIPHGREVGYRMPDGSVACIKHRFRTFEAADAELHRITRHAAHSYVPVRVYACDWCDGFHLTSKA